MLGQIEIKRYDMVNRADRLMALFAHLSLLVGLGIVGPLVIWLIKKDESPFIDDQAKEAINFHISIYLYGIISGLLTIVLIGGPMLFILGIISFILPIIAAIKANDGVVYRYPMIFRFV